MSLADGIAWEKEFGPPEPNTGAKTSPPAPLPTPTPTPKRSKTAILAEAEGSALASLHARERIFCLESALRKARRDLDEAEARKNRAIAELERSFLEEK